MEEAIDLNGFIRLVIKRSFRWVLDGCDGLTVEQLRYQPAPESNCITWRAWYSSRGKDQVTAKIVGEREVWITGGWAERFGMGPDTTGVGDSAKQVAGLLVSRDLLFGYAGAAHFATIERLSTITPAQFSQPVQYVTGDTRPAWQAIRGMLGGFFLTRRSGGLPPWHDHRTWLEPRIGLR